MYAVTSRNELKPKANGYQFPWQQEYTEPILPPFLVKSRDKLWYRVKI
jgi:hypothetical protein